MQNALSAAPGAPEVPNPQPQQMDAAPQGAPAQGGPPPPSHQQTAAALKHFDAIEKELSGLLANPDVGKADLKSAIIDGATKLVAQGILTPAAAVTQLSSVPEKPFEQKKWLETHLIQVVSAANAVLAHHAAAFAGQDAGNTAGAPADSHSATIGSLMGQYNGAQANG